MALYWYAIVVTVRKKREMRKYKIWYLLIVNITTHANQVAIMYIMIITIFLLEIRHENNIVRASPNFQGLTYNSTHASFGLMGIGMGSFLSIAVQFGIDQLYDASTDEISAYIMWHIWTCCCSFSVIDLDFSLQISSV